MKTKNLIGFLFSIFLTFPSHNIYAEWRFEPIDSSHNFERMTDRSIAIANNGNIHIAYGETHLYHAYYNGSSWHTETIDDSPHVGKYASIAIDKNDHIHIGYYSVDTMNWKYAYYDGVQWFMQTIDDEIPENNANKFNIALDKNNNPHIILQKYINHNVYLIHAYYDGANWQKETIGSYSSYYISTAIDLNDNVHASFCDSDSKKLYHAYRDATGCMLKQLLAFLTILETL